jgi:hypothetical protein
MWQTTLKSMFTVIHLGCFAENPISDERRSFQKISHFR